MTLGGGNPLAGHSRSANLPSATLGLSTKLALSIEGGTKVVMSLLFFSSNFKN